MATVGHGHCWPRCFEMVRVNSCARFLGDNPLHFYNPTAHGGTTRAARRARRASDESTWPSLPSENALSSAGCPQVGIMRSNGHAQGVRCDIRPCAEPLASAGEARPLVSPWRCSAAPLWRALGYGRLSCAALSPTRPSGATMWTCTCCVCKAPRTLLELAWFPGELACSWQASCKKGCGGSLRCSPHSAGSAGGTCCTMQLCAHLGHAQTVCPSVLHVCGYPVIALLWVPAAMSQRPVIARHAQKV